MVLLRRRAATPARWLTHAPITLARVAVCVAVCVLLCVCVCAASTSSWSHQLVLYCETAAEQAT